MRFRDTVVLKTDGVELAGELILPEHATSLVFFSHGSGSSRLSPRNKFVAEELQRQNIGTFLFDLLTKDEDIDYANRFNIDLLTDRLVQVTKIIASQKEFSNLNLGYFGASTGAASALAASAILPQLIKAVVSRGGRPDLAINYMPEIKAPVLLIVGSLDHEVLELNRMAYKAVPCEKKLEIVPGATHLFEEPGALHTVAVLAGNWFKKYLLATEKMMGKPH